MRKVYLALAGNISPISTQGTGPRPKVKEKVKARRRMRGRRGPAHCSTGEDGSFSFRKAAWRVVVVVMLVAVSLTVPRSPIVREHTPVENISRVRLGGSNFSNVRDQPANNIDHDTADEAADYLHATWGRRGAEEGGGAKILNTGACRDTRWIEVVDVCIDGIYPGLWWRGTH